MIKLCRAYGAISVGQNRVGGLVSVRRTPSLGVCTCRPGVLICMGICREEERDCIILVSIRPAHFIPIHCDPKHASISFSHGTGYDWPPYDRHARPRGAAVHSAHRTLRLLVVKMPAEAVACSTAAAAPSWSRPRGRRRWAAVRWGRTWAVAGACCPACYSTAGVVVVRRRHPSRRRVGRACRGIVGRRSVGRRGLVRRGRRATGGIEFSHDEVLF